MPETTELENSEEVRQRLIRDRRFESANAWSKIAMELVAAAADHVNEVRFVSSDKLVELAKFAGEMEIQLRNEPPIRAEAAESPVDKPVPSR